MPDDSATFAQRFGANLRELRTRRGATQRNLADLAGISPAAVGELERGCRVPRADTAFRLADALDVPVDRLFAGMVWISRASGAGEVAFPSRQEWRREVRRRAAVFRARQRAPVDVVALVREGREELERRGRPDAQGDDPPQ